MMKHVYLACVFLIGFTFCAVATSVDSLSRSISQLKGEERLKAYVSLCNILAGSGESGPAKELAAIRAYWDEACRQKNINHEANARSLQLFAYYNYNMPDSFFSCLPDHLEFMASHKQWYLYYACWNAQVERLLYDGKVQTALQEARKMYEDAKKTGDDYGLGISGYQLGSCYYSMQQEEEAFEYLAEAEQYLIKANATGLALNLYNQFWQIAISLKRYDEQLAQSERWQKLLDDYCHRNGLSANDLPIYYCYCALSKANAWMEKGELQVALQYLEEAEKYAEGNKSMPQVLLLRTRCRYEELCGNYDRAYQWAVERLRVQKSFGVELSVIEAQEIQARLLLKLDKGKEAALLYQQILPRKDSLLKWTMTSQLGELATIYQVDNLRMKEKEFRLYTIIAVGGCALLLLLLAGYVYYSYRLRKKNRAIYYHFREQERTEEEVRKVAQTLPQEMLSKELRLFMRLDTLMQEERLFVNPDVSRQELAERLGTNLTYLADAVREGAGKGIREYIADLRLKYAARLLVENPSLSIDSIGTEVGFNSRATFYRAFRNSFGMTPSDYRKVSSGK